MKQNENWEQPNVNDDVQATEVEKEEGISSSDANGSQLGKFKDAESLLSAYNNLQAEFTKKCQKLSALEKNQQPEEKNPVFMEENWTDKVTSFLQKNKDAKNYASEISSYIMENPEIMNNQNALELAWSKIVQQKYVAPEKLVSDNVYVEKYILPNKDLQEKIINNYIKQIQTTSPPPVISVEGGGNIAFATQKQALSLSEAKSLVEEIFNAKGE